MVARVVGVMSRAIADGSMSADKLTSIAVGRSSR